MFAAARARLGRVARTPRPKVLPHLTLRSRISLHPDSTTAAAERWGLCCVNISSRPKGRCLWSAIDGSRTTARNRRRDGLGTFACAVAFDRCAASAAPARARRRIELFAGAAAAFD